MAPRREGLTRLATVAVLTPLLLWPAFLGGHPYVFWDTYGYFTQGRDYWTVILAFLGQVPVPPEAEAGWIGAAGRIRATDGAIRSMSYSLLFWPAAVLGSFWLVATATAATAAYTVDVALDRLFRQALRRRAATFAVLVPFSTLSWFASYLMPDLFAGLMVLALATLAFAWDRLARSQAAALAALALLGASFHTANLPLALALAAAAAALAPAGGRLVAAARTGLPTLGGVVLLAGLAWLGFGTPSPTPRSPPFLLARQIGDGTALPYLREACGRGEDWALCPHVDRLPPEADDFLWSNTDSYWRLRHLQARLRAEEKALVLRAALARPLLQLEASAANWLRQLASVGLRDLQPGRDAVITPQDYWYGPDHVPLDEHDLGPFSALVTASAVLALLVVAWRAWPAGDRPGGLPPAGWFLLWALVANAAVCGILSGPHHRYQARVAWLLPLLAAVLVLRPGGTPAPGRVSGGVPVLAKDPQPVGGEVP